MPDSLIARPLRRPGPRPAVAPRPAVPARHPQENPNGPSTSKQDDTQRPKAVTRELPLVALRETVIFPEMIVPLQVGREKSVERAQCRRRRRRPDRARHPAPGGAGGHLRSVRALRRRHPGQDRPGRPAPGRDRPGHRPGPGPAARPRLRPDRPVPPGDRRGGPRASREPGVEVQALMRTVQAQIEQYVANGAPVPPEAAVAARNITEPGLLADMVAYSPDMTTEQRQELLETIDVAERLKLVGNFLARQIEILELKGKIQSEVKSEMDKTQREYILREQLKAIQRELGEDDPQQAEINELRDKVEAAGMPEEVKARALKEVDRMSRIPSASPEVGVIRTYVDWLIGLPWNVSTDDQLDIKRGRRDPRRGPLRPREDQGADPRVPRGPDPGGHDPQPDPRPRRPARRRQDVARQERRPGDGPQVRPDEPRRHPRRGRDPRPSPDLHRGAARPDHPERQDRRHEQPRVHARRDRQDRDGLPGRPVVGPPRGPRPRAEQHLPGQLPRGAVRPDQGAVHRDRQPHRPDPGRASRPDGDHPAAGLHPAGEDRDRQAVPRPQADGEPRPQAEEHRDHRRGDDRARPGLHQGGRRPEPRARDRQHHAQGRPDGGRGPQAQDRRRPQEARRVPRAAALRVRRAREPRTRPARRRASS